MDFRVYDLSRTERETVLGRISVILTRRNEVAFAYAYGSFVGGGPFRDLDLALYLKTDPPERDFLYEDRLQQELLAETEIPFPLDVRLANRAPIAFQYQIYRGRLLFDRDPDFRARVVAYVVSRYLDMKPVLDHHFQEAFPRES
jgi:predicted nucleotidyltransferase